MRPGTADKGQRRRECTRGRGVHGARDATDDELRGDEALGVTHPAGEIELHRVVVVGEKRSGRVGASEGVARSRRAPPDRERARGTRSHAH